MDADAYKDDLHSYLHGGRDALLWKLDGLGEYDVRRPLVPTGTNLLGLVKHLAVVEAWYFGRVFGRPFPEPLPWWDDDAEPNADMWATPEESRADIVGLYERAAAHADATIAALPLDAPGTVPWWNDGQVTLHRMLVHVTAETHRHAGHADLVRELIDGTAGFRREHDNLATFDADGWTAYRARLESAARAAADRELA
ncbi:MAG: DinB family protein [Candidatus Nanopelagicales bacterium]